MSSFSKTLPTSAWISARIWESPSNRPTSYQPDTPTITSSCCPASKISVMPGSIALALYFRQIIRSAISALAERYADSGIFGLHLSPRFCTRHVGLYRIDPIRLCRDAQPVGRRDDRLVADTRVYAERASQMKKIFTDNGFHIVYDRRYTTEVGDGFFHPSATAT